MYNRREFMGRMLAGAAGVSLLPSLLKGCAGSRDPLHQFGLITNVVREHMEEDHRGTMTSLAEMGYEYLEFGGTFGEEPEELKAFMRDIGLVPLAGGTSLAGMQGEDLQQLIDETLEMDKKYLVCYWPWMTGADEIDMDQVKRSADACNGIGEVCRASGLGFAFHNHDHEFRTLEGRVIYDYILANTEPELVTMQIDLYWAYKGGADIREYFRKYPGRFELVHVKDSYDSPDRRSFACVGDGILDFTDLFSYREVAGFRHLIVEHDDPENEMACARSSIEYLRSLEF